MAEAEVFIQQVSVPVAPLVFYDEASNVTPEMVEKCQRHVEREYRKADAMHGWVQWHLKRGRLYGSGAVLRKAMRQLSWRRVK